MKKITLDVDDLVVASFETTDGTERTEGTVFGRSTADCESDSGCVTALCTRDMAVYECRMQSYNACTPTCGDHGTTP